ncbi:hypothetical protein F5Y06DRAFT_263571 [Hypoxylon sp. FL0890]|nr:hypothetical protein F5Y06DRAFT_263571 [Hypoxylon sp. FL0890]
MTPTRLRLAFCILSTCELHAYVHIFHDGLISDISGPYLFLVGRANGHEAYLFPSTTYMPGMYVRDVFSSRQLRRDSLLFHLLYPGHCITLCFRKC